MSKRLQSLIVVGFGFLLLPHLALAQSAIAGVVKDSTGAVLPGVTVEASSPALIEKMKSATTNEDGQYRIVDLRPGTYSISFTLNGFATVVREGILLEANFTAPINVDMRVGSVPRASPSPARVRWWTCRRASGGKWCRSELLECDPDRPQLTCCMANTVPAVTTGGSMSAARRRCGSGGACGPRLANRAIARR